MNPLSVILGSVVPILDRFFPDKTQQAKFTQELTLELAKMDFQAMQSQVEVNKIEAQHANLFVAGWRPFIGWVGGVAIAWTYIGFPITQWFAYLYGYRGPLPNFDTGELMTLVLALLGIGAMRSYDKAQGTSFPGLIKKK